MVVRGAAGGFGYALDIAIAGKPAPTGDVCCPRLRRSRLAGDGDFEYANVANGCSGCGRRVLMVFWIVRDSVGAGLLAMAILNTPM
jgi:hypothetical protein